MTVALDALPHACWQPLIRLGDCEAKLVDLFRALEAMIAPDGEAADGLPAPEFPERDTP